jgi:hypothetical protein
MATETRSNPDWLLPALLILIGLVVGVAGWGIWSLTREATSEEASLAGQLEVYTRCLRDHGADVPLVESRSDGGFAVIVPGSLLDHDIDLEQWGSAADQCRDVQPNPFELLLGGGGLDLGGLASLLPNLVEGGGSFGGGWPGGSSGGEIEDLCRHLDDDAFRGQRRQLRELCDLIGA